MTIYALFTYVAFRDTLIHSNLKTGGMLELRETVHGYRGDRVPSTRSKPL